MHLPPHMELLVVTATMAFSIGLSLAMARRSKRPSAPRSVSGWLSAAPAGHRSHIAVAGH